MDKKAPVQEKDGGSVSIAHGPTIQSNDTPPASEVNEVLSFLTNFGRRQPTLCFLDHQTRRFFTRRYKSPYSASKGARWWCDNMGRSVYFVGNSHRLEDVRKPCKEDIALCVGAWIDVDCGGLDEDVVWALCSRLDWQPTYVAFTGGGYQAHWRFETHTEDRNDAEAVNLWLIEQFGDLPGIDRACWTCDHIWRLPGTRNRKPGRRDALSVLVHADWTARLPFAEAGRIERPQSLETVPVSFFVDGYTIDDVRECLSDRAFRMLTQRPAHCPSRSEHEFAFIGAVLGERDLIEQYDINLVAACLLADPFGEQCVSHRAYYLPDGTPRRDPGSHVARQIRDWLTKNGRAIQ